MKSLNVKYVASMGTAVLMAGSVIAPAALAAVDVGTGVNEFVQNILEKPEDTYAVVGSVADPSDMIAAAQFLDALREKTAAESEIGVEGGAGAVTIQGSQGSVALTAKHYDVEYYNTLQASVFGLNTTPSSFAAMRSSASAQGIPAAAGIATVTNVTITPDVLPGVLTRDEIEAYQQQTIATSGNQVTQLNKYEYEEQIIIGAGVEVKYDESESPAGHGLYVWAPNTVYTPDETGLDVPAARGNQFVYKLNFMRSGNGVPLNNTTWKKTPTMTVLKKEYAMDTVAAEVDPGRFILYPGEALKMLSGETYTTDDGYVVTLEDVGLQGSGTNQLYANVRVDSPDGQSERLALEERQGGDFFGGKVSVYADWLTGQTYTEEGTVTGRGDMRIGHGKLYFDVGRPFPLDEGWQVTAVDIYPAAVNVLFATRFLQNVTVSYGSPTATEPKLAGQFLGNEYTGLKQGVILNGPKNYDGTPVFNFKLTGFGGVTKTDESEVILKGAGSITAAAPNQLDGTVLQVTYTDRGGLLNKFEPIQRQQVVHNGLGNGITDDTYFNNSPLFTPTVRWGILGAANVAYGDSHVVYYDGLKSDSANNWWPVFKFGGMNGVEVRGTTVTSDAWGNSGTFTYTDIVGTMTCRYTTNGAGGVMIDADGNVRCAYLPEVVYIGSDLVMDRGQAGTAFNALGGRPFMNLTNITVGRISMNMSDDIAAAVTGNFTALFPMVKFHEVGPGGTAVGPTDFVANYTVVYDTSTAVNWFGQAGASNAANTGLVVANTTSCANQYEVGNTCINTVNAFRADLMGNYEPVAGIAGTIGDQVTYADTTQNPMREGNAYHTTVYGSLLETAKSTGANSITIKTPEAARNAVITVAEAIAEDEGAGKTTYNVGDILPDGSVVTGVGGEAGIASAKMYKTVHPFVLDSTPKGVYQVVIGGPWVNTLAKSIAGNEKTEVAAGTGYLIADGNKALAAGQTGQDTTEAVNKLISLLNAATAAEPEEEEEAAA